MIFRHNNGGEYRFDEDGIYLGFFIAGKCVGDGTIAKVRGEEITDALKEHLLDIGFHVQ